MGYLVLADDLQVVVGGGPTGVEFAAELQDFFEDDLKKWVPGITGDFHVTLVEALPNVCYYLNYYSLPCDIKYLIQDSTGLAHVQQDID